MTDITVRRPIRWHSAEATNTGMVREINEDSIMSKPEIGLWAVADGMGGYEAGNVASNMIVSALSYLDGGCDIVDKVNAIEDSILDANSRIIEYSEIMHEGRMLGSTVTSLLIHERIGACIWVGDSRLYLLRENELVQLSTDHSQVQELLAKGMILEDEMDSHPEANVITRAVGAVDKLCVDINVFEIKQGDVYLLCSDGLYNTVNRENIIYCLLNYNAEAAVQALIQTALENGAPDNVSAIVVKSTPINTLDIQ